MLRKVLVPVMFLSVGVFSTTMFFAGCSSDSTTAGTGGKGGAGTGGKGTGGAVGTGGTSVGTGGTAVTTGGAGGTVTSTGGAGGTVTSTGGAAGAAVGTGGSAGAGGARTGGAGGAVGGTSGAAGGMSGAAGGMSGAAGGAGGAMVWATTAGACMMPLPNVSVVDFCNYYMMKCADAYGTGVHQFANVADCTTKYTAYNATQKGCTAYHLCVAGTSAANATVHCPHPAGGTANPCMIP